MVAGDDVLAGDLVCLAGGDGQQGFSADEGGGLDAGEVEQGGEEVDAGAGEDVRGSGLDAGWVGDHERDAGGLFVEDSLLVEVVRALAVAVVAGEEDDGVVFQFCFFEVGEDLADEGVDALDEAVVGPLVLTPLGVVEVADGEERTVVVGLAHDGHDVWLVLHDVVVGAERRALVGGWCGWE